VDSAVVEGASRSLVSERYLPGRLQWLMFLRVFFTTVLLGSTIIVQFRASESFISPPLLTLYGLIATVYVLTFIYVLALKRIRSTVRFTYVQISLDTVFVTAIIYVTGGIASVFSFLYLVVVVYTSIFLYKRGSLIMAASCSIQYGTMIDLEYYGILHPFYSLAGSGAQTFEPSYVLYRVLMTMVGCFLVAFLSSYLAQQSLSAEKELKAKQKDLKQLEAFNASIIQSMDSGLLTLDPEGRITSFNRGAEEITGFAQGEVLGKPLAYVFPGLVERDVAFRESFQKARRRNDVEFRRKNGTTGYLGFSISSLTGPDGRVIGDLLIFQDLTALKRMEAHVKRMDKLAAIGEMAAGIAHEIKNPLASMSGSVQLLKNEIGNTPMAQKLMQIVLRETDRLTALANDFLLFAHPGPGKKKAIELSSSIEEILELFQQDPLCRNRIKVVRHLVPETWTEIDPGHMRQIFWNLLLNAAEAIDGSGRIEVSMKVGRELVHVAIKDNGCGISEENSKDIFNPFFSTKAHGSGLGLSIVHRLVECYDGHIEVQSREGSGATFILSLNRIDPPGSSRRLPEERSA